TGTGRYRTEAGPSCLQPVPRIRPGATGGASDRKYPSPRLAGSAAGPSTRCSRLAWKLSPGPTTKRNLEAKPVKYTLEERRRCRRNNRHSLGRPTVIKMDKEHSVLTRPHVQANIRFDV